MENNKVNSINLKPEKEMTFNKIIKSYSPHTKGWIIVLCVSFYYLFQFILRVSPNIMTD